MGLRDQLKRKLAEAVGIGGRGAPPPPREGTGRLPDRPDAEGYRAVAPASAVAPGRAGTFQVGADAVAIFRVEGGLYAIDSACVHEDGPLGEGDIHGAVVSCPYHSWRYDVRTGACLTEPSRAVGCWQVKESGGFLWVGRRTKEGSRDRGGEHDDGLKTT